MKVKQNRCLETIKFLLLALATNYSSVKSQILNDFVVRAQDY